MTRVASTVLVGLNIKARDMSKPFHCVIHARPKAISEGESVDIDGVSVATLSCVDLLRTFERSFEEVAEAFEKLPRMFFEPDGSFVWVVEREQRCQLDGSLIDNGSKMLNVELKGTCDGEVFDQFLGTLGWPELQVIFQLVSSGIYVDEAEFRRAFIQ